MWALCLLGVVACGGERKPSPPKGGILDITPDAGGEDVEEPDPDVPVGPACDALEPDNEPSEATALDAGTAVASRICDGDEDWFVVEAPAGALLTLEVTFTHARGDLDVVLHDGRLEEVARAESTTNNERLEFEVERAGAHHVRVFGFDGAENDYEISVILGDPPEDRCVEDGLEDNDLYAEAIPLLLPETLQGVICDGDEDWYSVQLKQDQVFRASLRFSHALGDLDMALIGPDGAVVAQSTTSDDDELVRHTVAETGRYMLRVVGYAGARAPYSLEASATGQVAPTHRVDGQITFDDPFLSGSSHLFAPQPLSGAVVEAIDVDSGQVLGQTSTDGRGRYRLGYEGGGHARVTVRVLARHRGPEGDIDVVTSQRQVYAVRAAGGFPPEVGVVPEINLSLTRAQRLSAPFNALDAAARAMSWWSLQFEVRNVPPMHLLWEDGNRVGCGTCYREDDVPGTVYLLGEETDNDALDDPVIMHEVGHYIMNTFSSDNSPGGFHDGSPVDPRLAWPEGWATAFSAMVRLDPVYYDTVGRGVLLHDLEEPDEDYAVFTGASVRDPISEYLVAALLWDFFDVARDGADRLELGPEVAVPVIEYIDQGQRSRRGVDGLDLVDYLDGLRCLEVAPPDALQERLEEAGFPYAGPPDECKPASPARPVVAQGVATVRPGRRLDGLELWRCDAEGCDLIQKLAAPAPGREVVLDVGVGAPGSWIEARAWRGEARWVSVAPLGPPREVKTPWTPRGAVAEAEVAPR